MAKNQFDTHTTLYRDKKWMENQYYNLKKTIPQIAKELDVGLSTVGRWFTRHNLKAREWVSPNKGKSGKESYGWKGNHYRAWKDGYYKKKIGNKTICLHNVLWGKYNNKKVPKGYVVHHLDCNPSNNNKNNLFLMKWNIHVAYHNMLKYSKLKNRKKFIFEIKNGEMILK